MIISNLCNKILLYESKNKEYEDEWCNTGTPEQDVKIISCTGGLDLHSMMYLHVIYTISHLMDCSDSNYVKVMLKK